MKKFLLLITCFLLFSSILIGCGTDNERTNDFQKSENTDTFESMLRVVYESSGLSIHVMVLADEQNVMYLIYDLPADCGSACMMLNPDGTPKIWTENEDFTIECLESQTHYKLFRDTSTNVLYLYTKTLLPMRNSDGTVKLYDK